ncbi:glycosyltransferase [Streptomyces xanthii]|uniref:glycosyltransferase n=1 Tax=Streptomyces xanthii TaxID=2768069 RepID=UPI001CB776DB|nr:glycosyltransferase [Streptomyces xanthii]
MRIALVHGFHGPGGPGGENAAVLDQAAALVRAGHDVHLVVTAAGGPLHAAPRRRAPCPVTVVTGQGRGPLSALRALAPDVTHIHHAPPGAGRAWAADWTGPLVATLRDTRPQGGAGGVLHRLAALPQARAARADRDPLLRRADRLVVRSEPARDQYLRAGVPLRRLALIPDFAPAVPTVPDAPEGPWTYVGRLAPETGILDLLRRWPEGRRLDVLGAGPLEGACRAAAPASVRFSGPVGRGGLRAGLVGRRGLVVPGRGAQDLPVCYAEALAAGVPVLAVGGAAVPRAVRAEGTGTVASWAAPLGSALDVAERLFPGLSAHCRAVHSESYAPEPWIDRVAHVYAAAVQHGPSGLVRG